MKLFKGIIIWMLFVSFSLGSLTFPKLNGTRVVDEANIFTAEQ